MYTLTVCRNGKNLRNLELRNPQIIITFSKMLQRRKIKQLEPRRKVRVNERARVYVCIHNVSGEIVQDEFGWSQT